MKNRYSSRVRICLSPAAAEKFITPRTKAIVPVHVYGNVCDVEGFDRLGEKYGVKVIYDAAHAFGIRDGDGAAFDGSAWAFVRTQSVVSLIALLALQGVVGAALYFALAWLFRLAPMREYLRLAKGVLRRE